jgi:hypothetical protein
MNKSALEIAEELAHRPDRARDPGTWRTMKLNAVPIGRGFHLPEDTLGLEPGSYTVVGPADRWIHGPGMIEVDNGHTDDLYLPEDTEVELI